MPIKQNALTGELSSSVPIKSDFLKQAATGDKPLPELTQPDSLRAGYAEVWAKEGGSDDMALRSLGQAHAELARTFENFAEVRKSRAPSNTQSTHLNIVASDFDRAIDRLAAMATKAQQAAQLRLSSIETEFQQSVGWTTKDAAELRSVIRSMPAEQRSEFIGSAIQSRDGGVLAAVLSAHGALSGLSPEQQNAYRQRALLAARPDLYRLERTIKQASETVRTGFADLLDSGDKITAADLRKEYTEQAKRAEEARSKLAAPTY